jgi:lysophospholipase L1-like esterase
MKSAVLFGDSITQEASDPTRMGWVSSLSAYWIRRIDVSNRGFGGYNSRWGLRIFEEAVMQQRPDIVVIFFGANDAVDERVPQSVPLEEYTSNLRTMVTTLQRRLPHTVVMLMTPPPVYEPVLEENNRIKGKTILSDRTCQRTEKYAAAVLHLGEQLGVSVVDNFYSMDPTKASREEYLRDGLHLSAKGNQRVYTNLVHTVERDHPALKPNPDAPAGDGMVWPHWSKIVANPAII